MDAGLKKFVLLPRLRFGPADHDGHARHVSIASIWIEGSFPGRMTLRLSTPAVPMSLGSGLSLAQGECFGSPRPPLEPDATGQRHFGGDDDGR
jgi:hypothetical protein